MMCVVCVLCRGRIFSARRPLISVGSYSVVLGGFNERVRALYSESTSEGAPIPLLLLRCRRLRAPPSHFLIIIAIVATIAMLPSWTCASDGTRLSTPIFVVVVASWSQPTQTPASIYMNDGWLVAGGGEVGGCGFSGWVWGRAS
jgi:hypothetical protein